MGSIETVCVHSITMAKFVITMGSIMGVESVAVTVFMMTMKSVVRVESVAMSVLMIVMRSRVYWKIVWIKSVAVIKFVISFSSVHWIIW